MASTLNRGCTIELDGTTTQADIDRIANDLGLSQKLQIARAEAMLQALLASNTEPVLQRLMPEHPIAVFRVNNY
jgi:hypothetical protein